MNIFLQIILFLHFLLFSGKKKRKIIFSAFFLCFTTALFAESPSKEPISNIENLVILHQIYEKESEQQNRFQQFLQESIQDFAKKKEQDIILPPTFKNQLKKIESVPFSAQDDINLQDFHQLSNELEVEKIPEALSQRLQRLSPKSLELAVQLITPREVKPEVLVLHGYFLFQYAYHQPKFLWFEKKIPLSIFYDDYIKNTFKRELVWMLTEPSFYEHIHLNADKLKIKTIQGYQLTKDELEKVELSFEKAPVSKFYLQGCEYSQRCFRLNSEQKRNTDIYDRNSELIFIEDIERAKEVCRLREQNLINENQFLILKGFENKENAYFQFSTEPAVTDKKIQAYRNKFKDYVEITPKNRGLIWCASNSEQYESLELTNEDWIYLANARLAFYPTSKERKVSLSKLVFTGGFFLPAWLKQEDILTLQAGFSVHQLNTTLSGQNLEIDTSSVYLEMSTFYYGWDFSIEDFEIVYGLGVGYNYYLGDKILLQENLHSYSPANYVEFLFSLSTNPLQSNGYYYHLEVGFAESYASISQLGFSLGIGYLF